MSDKILTIDDLINRIDEDLSWRKKELHYIKTQIPKDKSPKQASYLRLAIPLLYAHWEGFAKSSMEAYLKYVSLKFLKHNDLKPQFVALSLSKLLGLSEIKNLEGKTTIVKELLLRLNEKAKIPTKEVFAGTGFSLIPFWFAFRRRRPTLARAGLFFAILFGTVCGVIQMMRGYHFPSHNVATFLLDWSLSALVYLAFLASSLKRSHAARFIRIPQKA